jgi:hypothetical protein
MAKNGRGFDLIDLINSYMHPTVRLWWNLHLNTKLRNPGVRPGSYWVSPRAVSWVCGCRPPSLVVLSSVSRRLFQEPCTLGGHLTGSFPPFLHPSPHIFKPFFLLLFVCLFVYSLSTCNLKVMALV